MIKPDKYLVPRTVVIFVWACVDLGLQAYKRYTADPAAQSVSFSGHFVGFVGGMSFGAYILKNDVERPGELYIRWIMISIYLTGVIFVRSVLLFHSFLIINRGVFFFWFNV